MLLASSSSQCRDSVCISDCKQKQSCWLPHVRGPEDGKLLPVIEATKVSHKNEKSHSPVSSASFNLHLWPSLLEKSIKAISPTISLILAIISLLMTGFGWRNFLQIISFLIKKFVSATILTASVLKFHLTIIHQETEKNFVLFSLKKIFPLIWYYSKCN